MKWDDYTLVISVLCAGKAQGELYVDDGDSFDYSQGQYIHRNFSLEKGILTSTDAEGRDGNIANPGEWMKRMRDVSIDKIVIVGAPAAWAKAEVHMTSVAKSFDAEVKFTKAQTAGLHMQSLAELACRLGTTSLSRLPEFLDLENVQNNMYVLDRGSKKAYGWLCMLDSSEAQSWSRY